MFTFKTSAPIVQVSGSTLIAESRAVPETWAGAPGLVAASVVAVMSVSSYGPVAISGRAWSASTSAAGFPSSVGFRV